MNRKVKLIISRMPKGNNRNNGAIVGDVKNSDAYSQRIFIVLASAHPDHQLKLQLSKWKRMNGDLLFVLLGSRLDQIKMVDHLIFSFIFFSLLLHSTFIRWLSKVSSKQIGLCPPSVPQIIRWYSRDT